ncbi:hypothetical protein CW304_29160 [Bacillus sp. UFRGS-B20]|nr:hypothetical protein CW304_29160 [Bacillus sp. UFRGS-B20]
MFRIKCKPLSISHRISLLEKSTFTRHFDHYPLTSLKLGVKSPLIQCNLLSSANRQHILNVDSLFLF